MTTIAVPLAGQPIQGGHLQPVYYGQAQAQPQQPVVEQITFQRSSSYDSRGCCHWLGNLLWLLLGGWHLFLTWFIVGICLCITCVGIPCGVQVSLCGRVCAWGEAMAI